jgi:hypothetical protein
VPTLLEEVLHREVKSPGGFLKIAIHSGARAASGHIDSVRIDAAPVQFKRLRLTSFAMKATDVVLDVPFLRKEHKIRTLSAKTSLRAVITEDDLTRALSQGRATKNMGLKVKFIGDKMSVTGTLNFPLINGPISGIGRLRLAPGHKVNLDVLSLKLRGVEVPQFVKNQFMDHVNPVLDYKDLPFNPPFKGVKVEGSKATLYT